MSWINAKEVLPEVETSVLIFVEGWKEDNYHVAFFGNDINAKKNFFYIEVSYEPGYGIDPDKRTVYWMPLPEAPKPNTQCAL